MVRSSDLVVDLSDVGREDVLSVGSKGAQLGELIAAKFSVPSGFVVTSNSFTEFLKENKLDLKIKHLLGTVNYNNTDSLSQVASHIRKLVMTSKIPDKIVSDIFHFYTKLGKNVSVEIHSSIAFTSHNIKFRGIRGEANVIEKIRTAWALYFESKAVLDRNEGKPFYLNTGLSLVIQKEILPDVSGVMFTVDPVTSNKNSLIIEVVLGSGKGQAVSDRYEIDKKTFQILDKKITEQNIIFKKTKGKLRKVSVLEILRNSQKLDGSQIIPLARLGAKIEKHFYFPQIIDWVKEKDRLYIVNVKPITSTGWENNTDEKEDNGSQILKTGSLILKGSSASKGIGIGTVKIINSLKDAGKVLSGDIVVLQSIERHYFPAIKKTKAVIMENEKIDTSLAIALREFGIPVVFGVGNARHHLREGMTVTVNGQSGEIHKGSVLITEKISLSRVERASISILPSQTDATRNILYRVEHKIINKN